ncbi:flavin reductase family protein [Streptomyces celluloflavus]|uniref:flavin reductase family protein n=1 Tax=Streptomyces celluloflavus TaxID=58344 RepID=UPI0036B50322
MASSGGADTDTRDDVDPTHLREAMGQFASGVTVVTTATGEQDDLDAHGMTANAFTSVSLRPALVLISVSNAATTHRRIAESGRYGISVLSADQKSLSEHFAGGAQRPDLVRFVWRDRLPLVADSLVQLTCTVRQSHLAGDHTVYIGAVDGLWNASGSPLVRYGKKMYILDISCQDGPSAPNRAEDALNGGQMGRPTYAR